MTQNNEIFYCLKRGMQYFTKCVYSNAWDSICYTGWTTCVVLFKANQWNIQAEVHTNIPIVCFIHFPARNWTFYDRFLRGGIMEQLQCTRYISQWGLTATIRFAIHIVTAAAQQLISRWMVLEEEKTELHKRPTIHFYTQRKHRCLYLPNIKW